MQKCNFSLRLFSLFKISTRYENTSTVSTTVAILIMTPKHNLRYILYGIASLDHRAKEKDLYIHHCGSVRVSDRVKLLQSLNTDFFNPSFIHICNARLYFN